MESVSTPSKRALSASASAWVKAGRASITSSWRAGSAICILRVPFRPDRAAAVDRLLIDVLITMERALPGGIVQRLVGPEAVEAAAAHRDDLDRKSTRLNSSHSCAP